MMRYSVHPRERILGKGYGFLSFAKKMGKNIGKNISKIVSGKYSQKRLDHAKQSATDAFKAASKRAIQGTTKTTGVLFGNKIVNKITRVSKNLQWNNWETVTNEYNKEIPKQRYISPEKRQEIIDELRLK